MTTEVTVARPTTVTVGLSESEAGVSAGGGRRAAAGGTVTDPLGQWAGSAVTLGPAGRPGSPESLMMVIFTSTARPVTRT